MHTLTRPWPEPEPSAAATSASAGGLDFTREYCVGHRLTGSATDVNGGSGAGSVRVAPLELNAPRGICVLGCADCLDSATCHRPPRDDMCGPGAAAPGTVCAAGAAVLKCATRAQGWGL